MYITDSEAPHRYTLRLVYIYIYISRTLMRTYQTDGGAPHWYTIFIFYVCIHCIHICTLDVCIHKTTLMRIHNTMYAHSMYVYI